MVKKIVLLILIHTFIIIPLTATANNAGNKSRVYVHEEYSELLSETTYQNQDTHKAYFLLKDVATQFGYTLEWDPVTKTATVITNSDTIKILFHDQSILKNNRSIKEAFAFVENNQGRIVLEQRFLEEVFEWAVNILPDGAIDVSDDSFTWIQDTITRIYPEKRQFLLGTEKNGLLLQITGDSKIWDDTGLLNQYAYLQEGMVVSVKKSAIVGTTTQDTTAITTVVQSVDGGYRTVLVNHISLNQNRIICGPDILHPTDIISLDPDTIITDVNGNSLSLYDFKPNDVITIFHAPIEAEGETSAYKVYRIINHIQLATGYLYDTGTITQIDYDNRWISIFNGQEEVHFHLTQTTDVRDEFDNNVDFQKLAIGELVTIEYQMYIVDSIPDFNEAAKITVLYQ